MKILICYQTITGNTEKVAKTMADGLIEYEVTCMPAKDVDPASLNTYDIIFLGSGVYAATVGKYVKKIIKEAEELPSKFVFFYTHASPNPDKCFYRVEKQLIQKNCSIIARFDCLGDTKPKKEQLEEMTPAQRESYLKNLKGHPDEEDLGNAKTFAINVIKNL